MSQHSAVGDGGLRGRLYDVMADEAASLEDKQSRALAVGREYLGTETAYVQRQVDADTHEVVATAGDPADMPPVGSTIPRATTYCRRTMAADSAIAVSNAADQGWADDPAHREHGLECYLGTTVFVRGEPWGTVCFASQDVRDRAFDAGEKAFVELLARLLGRELEAARHDRELADRDRAIERSETRRRTLLETAPDAVVLVDRESGRVVEANAAAVDLVGYDREELRGMAVEALYPPGAADASGGVLERFLAAEGPLDRLEEGTALAVERRDGTAVPVEVTASTVALDGREHAQLIVRDVSDRRERERELRLKDRALESASVGVSIAESGEEGFPLVHLNEEFEKLTGYGDEKLGRDCRFLQGPETDEAAIDEIRAALDARESVRTELLNYRRDGTPFWNELTLAPVESADGSEVTHYVGFQRDVTARKRRESLIAVLNRVLRHNLRNDMNVVGGTAELLTDHDDEEVAALAETIVDTAADLTELSEKARTLEDAMATPGSVGDRPVAADLEAVAAGLRREYPTCGVTVSAPEYLTVRASPRLRLALEELGANAAEHGNGNLVRFEATDEGDAVEIRVHDAGPGLADGERHVLESGEETPLQHGQGLGLWLVNWVVTGMGGDVSTTVEEGTTVTIRLPTDRGTIEGRVRSRPAALGRRAE
ncbi:hypothetical protein BRD11_03365 [Halobacteriales archaeon SW_12_69_24]|nr:MAG: hypothetical protein BRD11_03365 [Halobacteriales archaeon SW_12_69_24]